MKDTQVYLVYGQSSKSLCKYVSFAKCGWKISYDTNVHYTIIPCKLNVVAALQGFYYCLMWHWYGIISGEVSSIQTKEYFRSCYNFS